MNRDKKTFRFSGRLLLSIGVALIAYFIFYRPLQLNWGATAEEIKRPMVGDEIVSNPTFNATRAVTIMASPEQIWPWLVQIGHKRAGWYSYDLLDNLAKPSAERIIPELQNLKTGDLIPISPNGKMGFRVKDLHQPYCMLWGDKRGSLSWAWGLYPLYSGHTRLITRVRLKYNWLSPTILFYLALDVGDLVMMRQSMLGVKDRAEGRPAGSMFSLSMELLVWIMALVGFMVAEVRLLTRHQWWRPLVVSIFAASMTILLVMWKPTLWLDIFLTLCIWAGVWRASRSTSKHHNK